MTALFAAILGFLAGIALAAAAILLDRRRRGTMAWPGKPIIIIDGEVDR